MLYSLTTHIIHVPGHGLGHEVRELLVIVAIFKILGLQVVSVNIFERATLVTRIDNPWLLLATLPLYHPVQDLKMTPLLQFTPVHFLKSTPLPQVVTL